MDGENGVEPILLPSQHAMDFLASYSRCEMVETSLDLLEGLFVLSLLGQSEKNIHVLHLTVDPRPGQKGRLKLVFFPQDVLRPFRLVPEVGFCCFLLEYGKPLRQPVYVKDNLAGFPPVS
jgi:hypothetical protein